MAIEEHDHDNRYYTREEIQDILSELVPGEKGDPGPRGFKGDKGDPGDDGPQGARGLQGIQGPRGLTGPDGPIGPRGVKGDKGDKGDKGNDGVAGPTGPQGPAGAQGVKGDKGDKGVKGDKGDKGEDGYVGRDGADGLRGVIGPYGQKGDPGAPGIKGDRGLQGLQGPQGTKGEKGDPGFSGRGVFTSYVFKTATSKPPTPTGGNYANPNPTDSSWNDTPQSAEGTIYMSQRIFTSDGLAPQTPTWSEPSLVADSATIEFMWSEIYSNPGTPDTHPANWTDDTTPNTVWMAVNTYNNGMWGEWKVVKIKGENGSDGSSNSGMVEVRYAKNGSTTVPPALSKTSRNPAGWTLSGVSAAVGEYVWFTQAVINVADNSLFQEWSEPMRASGIPGNDGTNGSVGISVFKSVVFTKTTNTNAPATPTGGSYSNPIPTTAGWSDGVPNGDGALYMSTRIFTSNGQAPQQSTWTTPSLASDSADIDIEWSSVQLNPGNPTANPGNWTNVGSTASIYMAVRTKTNGVWSNWTISKIKGENGKDGIDGTDGNDGSDGKDAFYLDLSNENASVAATFEGVVTGTIPTTKATVYKGDEIDTGWTFSAVFNGCTGTINTSTGQITMSTMGSDTASVVITATKPVHSPLTATYSLTKVRPGAPGEDAVVYYLAPSDNYVKVSKTGVVTPSSITCSKYKKVGAQDAVITSEMTLRYSIDGNADVAYAGAITVLATHSKITFKLFNASNQLIDAETVLVIKDGNDGTPGQNGDSIEVMYLVTNRGDAAPSLTDPRWTSVLPIVVGSQTVWLKQRTKFGVGGYGDWLGPIKMTGEDGDSFSGPSMSYRGDWASNKIYSGNLYVVDVVKYLPNGKGYIARSDAGEIPAGILPTNTNYWNEFTANIDSVFTDFLFSYKGYIQDLNVGQIQTGVPPSTIPSPTLDGERTTIGFQPAAPDPTSVFSRHHPRGYYPSGRIMWILTFISAANAITLNGVTFSNTGALIFYKDENTSPVHSIIDTKSKEGITLNTDPYWTTERFYQLKAITDFDDPFSASDYSTVLSDRPTPSGTLYYLYHAGENENKLNNEVFQKYHTEQKKYFNNLIPNGYYIKGNSNGSIAEANGSTRQWTHTIYKMWNGRIVEKFYDGSTIYIDLEW